MKQTAVEWFWDEIAEILPFTVDTETGMALYEAYQKAMKMETEQSKAITLQNQSESKAIPELSDEEIKEKMFGGQYDDQDINDVGEFEAAKWYREQLKQRQ